MEGDSRDEPVRDLDELQNADWVRISTYCIQLSIRSCISNYITVICMVCFLIIIQKFIFIVPAGTVLGAGDARSTGRCEVEESSGASVQPTTYRIPAHAVRNADGRHPLQTLQAAKSHGEGFTNLRRSNMSIYLCLAILSVF